MPGVRPVSTQGLAVHPVTFVEPRTMLTRAERLRDTDSRNSHWAPRALGRSQYQPPEVTTGQNANGLQVPFAPGVRVWAIWRAILARARWRRSPKRLAPARAPLVLLPASRRQP